MAVTTYAELKTAIGDGLDRSDLSTIAGDLITFAEAHLNRDLRHRRMVTTTDLTPSSNVCTLPTDYLHHIRVVEKASIRRPLEFISPDMVDRFYPSRPAGLASHFTMIGNTLTAYPLSSNDIELTYYQKIPALSDSNTTNWLLTTSPELYLRVAQLQALIFFNEIGSERFRLLTMITQKLISDLNAESEMAQYSQAGIYLDSPTP